MSWGVDYASVDGNHPPDFAAFKRAGGSFVWIRASYAYYDAGHRAWVLTADSAFKRDWAAAAAAGLVRGAYLGPEVMVSHTPEEVVGVFKASVDAAGGLRRGTDFPPCLDLEFPQGIGGTGMTRAQIMDWLRRAVAELRRLFGCWPVIYTSGRVWNTDDADTLGNPSAPDLVECPLWLAKYAYATNQPAVIPPPDGPSPPVPSPWNDEWHAHQDQGDARGVPGFSSTVDVDRFRVARAGDRGGHISWLQRALGVPETGTMDAATVDAVRVTQCASGLHADEIVGPQTFAAVAWRGCDTGTSQVP